MSIDKITSKKCSWIHISEVDEKTADFLKENYKFHTLDIEDVMSEWQRPKVEIYKYYLFLIAVLPYYDTERRKIRGREVDIFLTKDCLITICKNPNPYLDHIFERVTQSAKIKKMWFGKGSSYLLYVLLEKLFREANSCLKIIAKDLSEAEDDVYENELRSVARELALTRRSVLTTRRILEPQRFTMNIMASVDREFLPKELNNYFDNVRDEIEKMWSEANGYRDVIEGLHRVNATLVSERTNRVITILTVISAFLLPMTLLSGIYGMNLIRLPWQNEPQIVLGLFITVSVFTAGIIAYIFRKK